MKVIPLLALIFSFFNGLSAQDTIKYTSFEGDSSEWQGNFIGSPGDSSYLIVGDTTSGYNDTPFRQRLATGIRSWQINNGQAGIQLDSAQIAQYDSVSLSIRFSGTSADPGEGLDADDSIKIFISVNGAGFSEVPNLIITGSDNATFGFDGDSVILIKVDSSVVDSSTVYSVPTGVLDTLNTASTAVFDIFSGALNIEVMILVSNNDTSEVWNIDDIILSGQLKRALPISLNSLQVKKHDKGVLIKWAAGFEPNGLDYAVERSQNGHIFQALDIISGDSGEDNMQWYTYLDQSPGAAWNYYRIKQIYADGYVEYSEIKSIYIHSGKSTIIYPTVIQDRLNISSNELNWKRFQIVDSRGQRIRTGPVNLVNNVAQISLADCSPGVYFISLISDQEMQTFTFLKN
jgi:hypothetical protein